MAKIMIVDDSVVARMSIKACLPKEAHQLIEATDGVQAIERYRTEQPDITFMDLTMPGLDGIQALQQIRAIDDHALVIILTADIQRKTIDRVKELGAFAVVKKPPARDAVLAELERALAAKG